MYFVTLKKGVKYCVGIVASIINPVMPVFLFKDMCTLHVNMHMHVAYVIPTHYTVPQLPVKKVLCIINILCKALIDHFIY